MRPGDNATIACSATGDTPINIEWKKERGYMPQYITVFGGILQFQGISVNDEGKYVCSATNAVGRAEAVAEVIVQGNLGLRLRH